MLCNACGPRTQRAQAENIFFNARPCCVSGVYGFALYVATDPLRQALPAYFLPLILIFWGPGDQGV